MKTWWNSFKIAFSMYSKVPMPKSDWTKENMRYVMCLFPLIGVIIGAVTWLWGYWGLQITQSHTFYSIVLVLIPGIPVMANAVTDKKATNAIRGARTSLWFPDIGFFFPDCFGLTFPANHIPPFKLKICHKKRQPPRLPHP